MVKKLAVLLSLLIVPIAFATSMINSTGTGDGNVNNEITNLTDCICNLSEKCPCTENCLYGKGVCYRVNMNYNIMKDNEVCPYNYHRGNCRYGCGMHHYRGMYRGACRMGWR